MLPLSLALLAAATGLRFTIELDPRGLSCREKPINIDPDGQRLLAERESGAR